MCHAVLLYCLFSGCQMPYKLEIVQCKPLICSVECLLQLNRIDLMLDRLRAGPAERGSLLGIRNADRASVAFLA
jgi:hypothetical protein